MLGFPFCTRRMELVLLRQREIVCRRRESGEGVCLRNSVQDRGGRLDSGGIRGHRRWWNGVTRRVVRGNVFLFDQALMVMSSVSEVCAYGVYWFLFNIPFSLLKKAQ
ncbi:uncharacterized protein [Physcomitrium patens]|uniref:uncharacterized protein n=1 Tax=Physcomitrium patens TaxID=3218 RepID=UPI003CCDD2F9